jgi:hypothetical protein
MAKTPGPKTTRIREAIKSHPAIGNTELAHQLTSEKGYDYEVTPQDVASQRQALKKLEGIPTKRGKRGRKPAVATAAAVPAMVVAHAPKKTHASPADLLDHVRGLAKEAGGFGELKRIVEHFIEVKG